MLIPQENDGEVIGANATEIMLQVCVQTYNTNVVNGTTKTVLLSSHNASTYNDYVLTLHSPTDNHNYTLPEIARLPLI